MLEQRNQFDIVFHQKLNNLYLVLSFLNKKFKTKKIFFFFSLLVSQDCHKLMNSFVSVEDNPINPILIFLRRLLKIDFRMKRNKEF